jgi:hypothetical protein
VAGEAAGFWSYVHQDDQDEGGRILGLAARLSAAYRLLTGGTLDLFVDRDDVRWGDEWSKRINEAIAGTTFFLPIITPSDFESQECRRELLKFAAEAQRLGVEQLLMPVYWAPVPELDQAGVSALDEAIALVAQYQWQDFREVRLEDEGSSAFRKAVHALGSELARRVQEVTATGTDLPPAGGPEGVASSVGGRPGELKEASPAGSEAVDDEAPGLLELWADAEDAMPELGDILEAMTRELERVANMVKTAGARVTEADARGDTMKARLVVTQALARQLAEPAERIQELGHRYAATLVKLDPAILTMLEVAGEDESVSGPELAVFLTSLRELAAAAESTLQDLGGFVASIDDTAKLSRSLRRPLGQMRTGLHGVIDGKAIIDEWGRRAQDLERRRRPTADDEPPAGTDD